MRNAIVTALITVLTLAGCASEPSGTTEPEPTMSATGSATPSPTFAESPSAETEPTRKPTEPRLVTIDITIKGGTIRPNGKLVEAKTGEPIRLRFTSDRAGELHVHSKPEQVVSFQRGTSTSKLVVDTPGVVEVEDHQTGIVVIQLEVR